MPSSVCHCCRDHPSLHSFPTRRSSDLQLAQFFLDDLNRIEGTTKSFSRDALVRLYQHNWPGNVRELRNYVQRAYIMADDVIECDVAVDRKSTRLNSSHVKISYAVVCLSLLPRPPVSTLFPYTTLFRSAARPVLPRRPEPNRRHHEELLARCAGAAVSAQLAGQRSRVAQLRAARLHHG